MKMILQGRYHDLKAGVVHYFAHGPANWWYKKTVVLLISFICLLTFNLRAQGTVKYTVTYVEASKTVYKITDSVEAYSIAEKVKLLPEITRDSVIKQVYTNNDIKTTIFHLENNSYEDWQTKPYKTIIDKSRIKIYNAAGAIILNELHSTKYKNANSQLKSFLTTKSDDIIPDFVFLTATMKTDFTSNGFTQTNIGGGTFKYQKDSLIIYFNNSKRLNEFQLYKTDGTLKYAVKKAFVLNSYAQIVPSAEVRSRVDTRFPGSCVQEMQIIEYPYFKITMAAPGKIGGEGETDSPAIEVNPNPATANILINIPTAENNQQVVIYDNVGRKVNEFTVAPGEYELNVDISKFESGIYYIQLIYNDVVLTNSFVKN